MEMAMEMEMVKRVVQQVQIWIRADGERPKAI